jgi:AraC family transcriptional regulator
MGMTPHRYATMRRVDRAKTVLLSNRLTVGEIAELLGFSGHATFTRWFTQHTGLTPRAFRSSPQVF